MTISELFKYILLAIPALIAFGVLVSLITGRNKNILDQIKNGLLRLRRKIGLVILFVFMYLMCYFGMKQIQNYTEASVVIGFHYPEASRGLNPNMTRFNASEILADDVLETAIEKGGLEISAAELGKSLRVEPLKAGDHISVDKYYISTEYLLKYIATKETLHLKPDLVVDMVSHAYYEKFVREYARNTNLLNIDNSMFEGHEYQELTEIFDTRAANIQNYAGMCAKEAPSFRSKKTGETFFSIEQKVVNLRDVQLERYQAFVLKHGLAKNKKNHVAKINYQNQILNKNYMKNLAYYQVRLDAIDMYERDMATIVEVPTHNNDGEFYMSRTKIGVDGFAAEAETYMQYASDLELKITKNDDAVSRIQAAVYEPSAYAQADEMIVSMAEELKKLAELMKDTLEEYNTEMTRDYVGISSSEKGLFTKYGVKKGAVAAAASGFLLSVLLVVLPEKKGGRR